MKLSWISTNFYVCVLIITSKYLPHIVALGVLLIYVANNPKEQINSTVNEKALFYCIKVDEALN